MKKCVIACVLIISVVSLRAQVAEMSWALDYQIYLKLANDSNFVYDIREAFHVTNSDENITTDFVFYPVNPEWIISKKFPAIQQTMSRIKHCGVHFM